MQEKSRFTFKPYPFTDEYEGYIEINEYSVNCRPALQLYHFDAEFQFYMPYATLTVNIPSEETTDRNCVFIDTNNCPFALNLLVNELKCAELTGHVAHSGRCYYSEVRLIPDELFKYVPYKGGE